MPRRHLGSTFALLTATALLAACTGSDDSADSTSATSAPAVTETPTTDAPETTDAPDTTDAPVATEPDGDFDAYAQTLEWSECELGECAEATVPIDYEDPSAGFTTIAMAGAAATGTDDKIGTLFINPGGPGGSGIELLGFFTLVASPEVLASYDVVGFDPRGVGQSDPLGCLDTEGLDELLSADVDPDDQQSVDDYTALVDGQGEACLETNPELSQHVTTVETAMDLDVLRALAGDDELHYIGFSYGTFLGTTYAALFPDNVGRLVLDGAMDPSLTAAQTGLRQAGGFQLAFDDYAADCVENDCALGASVEEIEQQVIDLFATTADGPLPTDDPDRSLTQAYAFYGVAQQLYAEESWPFLTEALASAFEGDGSLLLGSADEYSRRTPDGYLNNQAQANSAINCLDDQIAPEPDSTPTEEDFLEASPLFGAIAYGFVEVGCDGWPIAPTVEAPDYTAEGAAPILVVGTTGDPATPIESAQKLAELLDSGVLLTREGEGHTAYLEGNPCITSIIDAYLLEGTVPEDGTTCSEEGELVDTSGDATTTTTSTTTTAPEATAAPETTAPSEPDTTDGDPNGESALGGDPEGTVSMTAGGTAVFDGQIVQCTLVEPDVAFTAQGETSEIEVISTGGGSVDVVGSGAYEFEGTGTVAFGADTEIDRGSATITGSGSQPDDSASTLDFTIDVTITSC